MSKRAQPGAPAIGAAGTRVQAGDASTERAMLFLGHLVALCTARTRPAPRNNRASTINHAKTRTAWRTGDWGCGHACTGRECGHQAPHARASFPGNHCKLYQRKQKINRQIHEHGEETGRVNRSHGETRETRYDFLYTIGKPMSSATSSRCPRSNRTVFTTHKNVFPV